VNITIDLPNAVYERLAKYAQTQGKTIVETIEGKILPKHPLPPDYQRHYKRIEVQGKPVSECLIEERR
jgi:macrodomain Ter protein organizer (MatP/YcbG family)